jgi:hypothetical protein
MAQYKHMMTMYEDMQQKKAFAKAAAIVHGQAALPITAFQTDIVDMVRSHPVLILAGVTHVCCSLLFRISFMPLPCLPPLRSPAALNVHPAKLAATCLKGQP